MYYFDNNFLKQYVDQGVQPKVFVNQEWYQIADMSDLEDNIDGIGYDVYGGDHRFSYRDIQQIKVGEQRIDLEMLQKLKQGKPPEKEDKPSKNEEPPEEEPETEEPTDEKPKKEPDLSWFSPHYEIGKNILKEVRRKMK